MSIVVMGYMYINARWLTDCEPSFSNIPKWAISRTMLLLPNITRKHVINHHQPLWITIITLLVHYQMAASLALPTIITFQIGEPYLRLPHHLLFLSLNIWNSSPPCVKVNGGCCPLLPVRPATNATAKTMAASTGAPSCSRYSRKHEPDLKAWRDPCPACEET